MQDCSKSFANALELLQSCTKPLICSDVSLFPQVPSMPPSIRAMPAPTTRRQALKSGRIVKTVLRAIIVLSPQSCPRYALGKFDQLSKHPYLS